VATDRDGPVVLAFPSISVAIFEQGEEAFRDGSERMSQQRRRSSALTQRRLTTPITASSRRRRLK